MRLYAKTCVLALALVAPLGANAFNLQGGDWTATSGSPWSGFTNYRYSITTNGTNGVFDQQNAAAPVNLGIANGEWINANAAGKILMSGRVDILPTLSSSYLQIGLITRAQAERAAGWRASGMFNNAAFINFMNTGISLGDSAQLHTPLVSGLSGTNVVDYQLEFDFSTFTMAGRVNVDGGGWTAWQTRSFGFDNWAHYGHPSKEGQAYWNEVAVLANFYNENGTGNDSRTRFGEVGVTVVPGPAAALPFLLGGLLALKRRKR